MSLIYRAIWQDHAAGIHERALRGFDWWVNLRNPGSRTYEPGHEQTVGGATTLVRTGSGAEGTIQRCSIHVDDGDERLTTTLITTATHGPIGSVWVDQERVSRDAFAPFTVHAPELSTRLIATGLDPRRGPVRLDVDPKAIQPANIPGLVRLLTDPRRDLPAVVYASTPDIDPKRVLAAGIHAARVLAGSAVVFLISPVSHVYLTELLGAELTVDPGAVRVYLPGVTRGETNPARHRSLQRERVLRDPESVPHTIMQLLAPATAARRAPAEYPRLRGLLRSTGTPADQLEEQRAEQLDDERRIDELELTLAATEDRVLDLVTELGDSQARVNELQEQLVGLLVSGRVIDPVPGDRYFADIDCCTDAARSARRHLGGIMLPEAACHDLAELDRRLEAKSWGQTAWRALMALHAFASDTSFAPGFWEWCVAGRSPLTWPASSKKLAMHESESVMQNDALRAQRLFPIDERVDPSGRIIMEAHIKIVTGGGPQIPRIYFYDDRHGPTGKVHIGFFGPHWRVPTATTG